MGVCGEGRGLSVVWVYFGFSWAFVGLFSRVFGLFFCMLFVGVYAQWRGVAAGLFFRSVGCVSCSCAWAPCGALAFFMTDLGHGVTF